MKCLICNSETKYFFSKKYTEKPFDSMMEDIGEVNYYKCTNCGFTLSKTHCNLDTERWNKLNFDFHHFLESNSNSEMTEPFQLSMQEPKQVTKQQGHCSELNINPLMLTYEEVNVFFVIIEAFF